MKKNMLRVLAGILAMTMLAGCGGGAAKKETAAPAAAETEAAASETAEAAETEAAETEAAVAGDGETKVIYIYQMKTEIQDALTAVTEKYKETHPGVEFVLESASDNYDTGLKTKFQGGEAPDIFSIQGYTNALVWDSKLEDLSDQSWTADMISASAENVTINGAVKAWPLSVEAAGYVYNAGLFEQAGVTEVPTTREALADAVGKLSEAGVAYPISECYMDWYQLGNFMVNLGFAGQDDPVAFINGLNDGSQTFTDNAVWQELADYITFEYELDTDPQTMDFNTQTSLVGTQDLAITIGGNWSQPTYDAVDPELPVSLMGIPFSSDAAKNDRLYLVGTYWGVNAESPVKEEAKEFLNWLVTSDEGKACLTQDLQVIPAYNSVAADEASIGRLGKAVEDYIAAGKVGNVYYTFYPDGFAQAAGEAVQRLGACQSTAEEFLQELQDSWNSLSE